MGTRWRLIFPLYVPSLGRFHCGLRGRRTSVSKIIFYFTYVGCIIEFAGLCIVQMGECLLAFPGNVTGITLHVTLLKILLYSSRSRSMAMSGGRRLVDCLPCGLCNGAGLAWPGTGRTSGAPSRWTGPGPIDTNLNNVLPHNRLQKAAFLSALSLTNASVLQSFVLASHSS